MANYNISQHHTFNTYNVMQIAYLAAFSPQTNPVQETFHSRGQNQGLENLRALSKSHIANKMWFWG